MPSAAGIAAQGSLESALGAARTALDAALTAFLAAPSATTHVDLMLARGTVNAVRRARRAALELT